MQAIQNASTCRCGLQMGNSQKSCASRLVIKTFNLCRLSSERDLALALSLLGICFARRPGFESFAGAFHVLAFAMPPTDEDIAWLRSSFHPVPRPQLPDDCVEYSLYIISQNLDPTNDSEARLRLRDVQKAASDLQKKWLKDYIWQRQGFGLELAREDGEVCHAPRAVQPPTD
jgi:hypothetical protein